MVDVNAFLRGEMEVTKFLRSLLDRPKESRITLKDLFADEKTTIELLGSKGSLKWLQKGRDLTVTLPPDYPVSEAYTLKITTKTLEAGEGVKNLWDAVERR